MKKFWLLWMLLFFFRPAFLQEPAERKQLAKDLILNAHYSEALTLLRSLKDFPAKDPESRFLTALCHFQLNELDAAEAVLKELTGGGQAAFPECWLFLGKVFHARHQFAEAAQNYKTYLRSIPEDYPNRRLVLDDIRRCAKGIQLQYRAESAFVESLGPEVNTAGDEFGAVISPNFDSRLYFSGRRPGNIGGLRNTSGQSDERFGQYFSDIYSVQNNQGVWGNVQPMHHLLNGPGHEVVFDFNDAGSVMYYFQGPDWNSGAVMMDTFRDAEQRLLQTIPFSGPADPTADQAAPHFVNAHTVIFPSRRPGGYGGFDLYLSVFSQGRWSEPKNLGPEINSPYDETTPFLARDGRTLFFSSNHSEQSIGGFDIFRSVFIAKLQRWMPPENLGMPLNSSGDDTHFRLGRDGFSAFFTSSRKDGLGLRDLYVAYFDKFLEAQEDPDEASATLYYRGVDENTFGSAGAGTGGANSAVVPAPVLEDIRFDNKADLLTPLRRQMLDQLAAYLKGTAQAKVVITVLSRSGKSIADMLSRSILSATPLVDYLQSKGAAPTQIAIQAGIADLTAEGIPADRLARFAIVDQLAQRPAYRDGLVYTVRLAEQSGSLPGNLLNELDQPWAEKNAAQPLSAYFSGRFFNYAQAEQWQSELIGRGISNARITVFIDGWRASEEAIRDNLERFPDLQTYLIRQGR